jgi:uncharacterized membrane protein
MTGFARHKAFYVAAIGGILTFALIYWLKPRLAFEAGANVFFIIYLAMTLLKVRGLSIDALKRHAADADEPGLVVLLITSGSFAVAAFAVGSLFRLINGASEPDALELGLSLAAVGLGWATIHMMMSIHYAHRYWAHNDPASRGFEFPHTPEPCGWDFLYFAFVIGMTAQTSDTSVTNTAMRRMTLLHSILSFLFNTVLVAAAVNVAVSLGTPG